MNLSTRTTEYRYNPDGKLEELIVRNEATGDEVTRWEYGVTKEMNGIASNELLRAKVYPDSDDLVEYVDPGVGFTDNQESGKPHGDLKTKGNHELFCNI
jgi:hypothetical protein